MRTVLFNAFHTTGGGGLVYLQNVLPYLAQAVDVRWILVLSPAVKNKLTVPAGMEVVWAPEGLNFWKGHVWEQGYLPVLQKKTGAEVVLCNANYGPLFARNIVPIIHTTPRAAGSAKGLKMWMYWRVLWLLTAISVWKAVQVGSVAAHVLRDYGGAGLVAKTVIVPPGKPENFEVRAKDRDLVVAVGDVYGQKHYPLMVEAFAKLLKVRPGTRLEILGRKVDGAEVVRVETEVVRWSVANNVAMVGGVPHAELLARLSGAAVLVNVSGAECFNMPLLEAMAVGTVVVCGDVPFQREVVGEKAQGAAVLVKMDGDDVAADVAQALKDVLDNRAFAEGVRAKGFERASGFTWERTAAGIVELVRG